MIKAILLDLGNVVIGLDFPRAYRAAAKLARLSPEQIPELIAKAELSGPYEHGRITSREFHRRFSRAIGLEIPFAEFRRLWGDMFHPEPLLNGAFLEELKKKNYRLLAVSNTNELHFEWLQEHYAVLSLFDDYVLSYRVGSMKPDAEIYREAIRRSGCTPKECFYTDDKPKNVEAARKLGIDAVLFRGARLLRQELRERGVQVAERAK